MKIYYDYWLQLPSNQMSDESNSLVPNQGKYECDNCILLYAKSSGRKSRMGEISEARLGWLCVSDKTDRRPGRTAGGEWLENHRTLITFHHPLKADSCVTLLSWTVGKAERRNLLMIYIRNTGFRDWVIFWRNDLILADEDGDLMLVNHRTVPNINQHLQFQILFVFSNSILSLVSCCFLNIFCNFFLNWLTPWTT